MIHVLKQRYFAKSKLAPMFPFEPRIEAQDLADLFLRAEDYLKDIPEHEKFNLHYTISDMEIVKKEKGTRRVFKSQNIIPFDIDNIDVSRFNDYIEPCLTALGDVHESDTGIVFSGRGLHFLIGTAETITDKNYFEETRHHYRMICKRVNRILKNHGLPGECDDQIWTHGHTLRMPCTRNIKTPEHGYPKLNFKGECKLIQRNITYIPELKIKDLSGVEDIDPKHALKERTKVRGGTFSTDTKAVLSDCEFLKWTRDNQADVNYTQWRTMLGVVGYLDNWEGLIHEFSKNHPDYSEEETEDRVEEAVAAAPPRTCKFIDTIWDGCKTCKWHQKCTSPVSIKGETYIATRDTGFRLPKFNNLGEIAGTGKACFEDLIKYYKEKHEVVISKSGNIYIFNGTYWELQDEKEVKQFAYRNLKNPIATVGECNQFFQLLELQDIVDDSWFDDSIKQKINLMNGVLDMSGDKSVLIPHSTDFGFKNVLPYKYDEDAECPNWDSFMEDITLKRPRLIDILQEFAGYSFSNCEPFIHKALIMLGSGSNGKSTYLETLQTLAGEDNFTAFSLDKFDSEYNMATLQGVSFNASEETNTRVFDKSHVFKNLVSGGRVQARLPYGTPFKFKPTAKFIMSINEMPYSSDYTDGFYRRILIVPFNAKFKVKEEVLGGEDHVKSTITNISESFKKEYPGILNWIIKGYYRLKNNKKFTLAPAAMRELSVYKKFSNPIEEFNDEFLISQGNPEKGSSFDHIYLKYREYCMDCGYKSFAKNKFAEKLGSVIPNLRDKKKRIMIHGTKKTVYGGVYLKANDQNHEF